MEKTVSVRLRAVTSGFESSMRSAAKSMEGLQRNADSLKRSGKWMSKHVTAPILGVGAAAIWMGTQFESAMSGVEAVTGATDASMASMSETAQELGRTTQFSATQAARGLEFLAMAGFSAEEATKALPDTLSLAAAGGMELAQSADLASNVLQQFALEVDETGRVADVLAQAAASSNTSVAQLGEGMKMAGPIANAAGLSIEETAAAMGKMGDAGIQASMAGTSLRGAMTRLLNASGPAEEALDRLGITAENADGTLRPLPDIIDQLADSGATAGDMMEIFGQRAGPAMAALVEQGGDSLRDLTAELENSSGAAEEMAKVRMDNLSGDLQKLKSAAEGAGIALFEAGLGDLLRDAAQGATAAVQGFAELPDPLLKASIAIGGVTAATGPAILGVGMLANAAPAIAANFRAGRTQLRRFATFMAGPWGAAVFAGAALLNTMKNNAVDTSGAIASLEAELGGMKATSDALSDMFLIEGLRDAGVLTTFDELGLSLDDLRTAALGNEDALSRLVGPIDELEFSGEGWSDALHNVTFGLAGARSPAEDLRAELLGLVEGTDEYNAAAEVLAEKGLEKARTATRELGSHMERMPAVFNNGRDAFDGLSEAALKQAEALELAEEASKRALEQLNEYLDAQRAATDPVFALNDALRGVEEAQANFNETSKDSEATQADVERAAFDLTEALVSLEVAALDNELSFEDFERQLERWIEDERIGQEEADALRQRVEELTGASEDYEGEYIATLVADVGEAEGAIDALIDALMEAGFTRGQAAASARWTARANVEITTSGPGSDIHNVVPNLRTEARASGGLMYPGTLYMTGEEGPELMTVGTTSRIHDAQTTRQAMLSTVGPMTSPVHSQAPRTLRPVQLVLDGRVLAEAIIDPLTGQMDSRRLNTASL